MTGLWVTALRFDQVSGTGRHVLYRDPQEEPHFLALVPSHLRVAVLLAFLCYQVTRRLDLLRHELRGPFYHVLLLLFDGRALKPKWFKAVYITIAQISQMFVGVSLTITGCYILWASAKQEEQSSNNIMVEQQQQGCWLSPENNTAALVMYGSYLFLFVEFFFKRYQRANAAVVVTKEKTCCSVPPEQAKKQYAVVA